ncbi:acetylglutamate kinase [Thalassotalea crassostreae]|uniref:acetylglutamate kinase n=2 Tax=Thalassotalea crassostreae TaxID=1763536 RepID=UPI001D046F9A|nr:acetylglutamate kinase [Thalassotalea crassostreae]
MTTKLVAQMTNQEHNQVSNQGMSQSPLVIKIGGAIMESTDAQISLFNTIKKLQKQNRNVVIVHGGGCVVDQQLAAAGFVSDKIDGLRVSSPEHMDIIVGALSGSVNKNLVSMASSCGISSIGLALHDGNMIKCVAADAKLGCVGIPQTNDHTTLEALMQAGNLVFISSIGSLANGQLVNVNADDAAVAISELIDAELVLLTDVAGVKGKDDEYLAELNNEQAQQLIDEGIINGGMIAKVRAAFAAATQLRRSIAVASWKTPEQLLLLQNGQVIGTRINP